MADTKVQNSNMEQLEALILGKKTHEVNYVGGSIGYFLYSGTDAAIQRAFLPAGVVLNSHAHKVLEIIIGLSGRIVIEVGGRSPIEVTQGTVVCIPVETSHVCEAIEDSWVVGMLIPHNGGYPGAS